MLVTTAAGNESARQCPAAYWPNFIFYSRSVPDHPTRIVGVVGGHHDNPRMGELTVSDPALGRYEAVSEVQRILGLGKKLEAIVRDGLTLGSWPGFLHRWPLSEKHFLVSCKPSPQAERGLYFVDGFDNFAIIKEPPGCALLEPIPLRPPTGQRQAIA